MSNPFNSIAEILADPIFQGAVKNNMQTMRVDRMKQPPPKPGFRYVRDGYDRMVSENLFRADYFIANAEAIWTKTSQLCSEYRRIIHIVIDKSLADTFNHYQNPVLPNPPRKMVMGKPSLMRKPGKTIIIAGTGSTINSHSVAELLAYKKHVY